MRLCTLNRQRRLENGIILCIKEHENILPSLNPSHQGRESSLAPCGRGSGEGYFRINTMLENKLDYGRQKAAIIKILEMAIIEEIKAKNFYFKMSVQLANSEAQSRFRHMAEAEQEHEDILKAWYEETCGYPFDASKAQSKEYKLDITEPEHNATFLDILKLIAKVENKAFQFYKEAALLARTPEEKRMFERLASLEQMHADQSQIEVQMARGRIAPFLRGRHPLENIKF